MCQPLENLECTRRQRNWSISVRVRWVTILEDRDNLIEPTQQEIEETEKHGAARWKVLLESAASKDRGAESRHWLSALESHDSEKGALKTPEEW